MNLFFIAGTQLPFPRMDQAISALLKDTDRSFRITYQSGRKEDFSKKNLQQYKLMDEEVFINTILNADLIIAHAGVGTLLECIENKKPVFMFPRLAKLKEHRNDHQLSTAKKINEIFQIPYFLSVDELVAAILQARTKSAGELYYHQMQKNRTLLKKNIFTAINEVLKS